ncbi:hypothetical protein [Streptacidiphilus anmyonensis]|uniref:hypothetical protein n=1 Tax=Streptacidiphilus anmyonensis TaxID=405782 RepID=UPI0005A7E2CA|nr:hypothetical protein [Streptacidiphilus anmyonensis]
MAVEVREQMSSVAVGADHRRRQENRWAAFLVGASVVGLIVLTPGMWYGSLPLLGCVELILVIGLATGVALLRRNDGRRTVLPGTPPRSSAVAAKAGHVRSHRR